MFTSRFLCGATTNEEVNQEIDYYSRIYSKMSDASLENVVMTEQMNGNYYGNECRLAEIELRRRNNENADH